MNDDSSLHLGQEESKQPAEDGVFDNVAEREREIMWNISMKGNFSPGVAQAKIHDSAKISVLDRTGIRKWKWHEKEDSIVYPCEDFLKNISNPVHAKGTVSRPSSFLTFEYW